MKTKPNKKDRMAILDQPIEECKKPMGQSVNFGAVMDTILAYQKPKSDRTKKK